MKERLYPFVVKAKIKDADVLVYADASNKHEAERMVQRMYASQFNIDIETPKAEQLNHLAEFYSNKKDYYVP